MPKPRQARPVPKAVIKAVNQVRESTPNATERQAMMAINILSGMSQVDSYRQSHDVSDHNASWLTSEASKVAHNPRVSAMTQAGREVMNHVRASRKAEWREFIDEKLWERTHSDDIGDKDLAAMLRLAGSQVHVQAYAKAADADVQSIALAEAISGFFSMLSEQSIQPIIDIQPCIDSRENPQVVDSIALRHLYPLDECAGGGCD